MEYYKTYNMQETLNLYLKNRHHIIHDLLAI